MAFWSCKNKIFCIMSHAYSTF